MIHSLASRGRHLAVALAAISLLALAGTLSAHPYRVVYWGSDGVSLRTGPGTGFDKSGSVHLQNHVHLQGTGACSGKWVEVTVTGWMVAETHHRAFLSRCHDNLWRVNPQHDGFLSMRSGTSLHSPLVGKIHCGTHVREIDRAWSDGRLWVYASLTRWVATNVGGQPLVVPAEVCAH